jgi:hypothetical protein
MNTIVETSATSTGTTAGTSTPEIPVIIYHVGNQPYVYYCLKKACETNPVIHINGDQLPQGIDELKATGKLTVANQANYSAYYNKFFMTYKHFSSHPLMFEFLSIYRWIAVYNYMKVHKIPRAFICDSDVLVFENITEMDQKYWSKYPFMLCSSISKDVTGGQSIWNCDVLGEFVRSIFQFYQTQTPAVEQWFQKNKHLGNICDMTLLYYFAHGKKDFVGLQLPDNPTISNDLTQIFDDRITCDLHIGAFGNHAHPDDYEKYDELGIKKFTIGMTEDGRLKPFCYNRRLGKNIQFILIHFWGGNKRFMQQFVEQTDAKSTKSTK